LIDIFFSSKKDGDVNLLQDKEIYDVHVIAGLLKLYLRELPTTIMTKEFQPRFIEIACKFLISL